MKRAAPPPAAGLRQRVQRWWLARLPATDHLELTQHNIFLLPTGAGWMLALTLLVLLIASINFQLNLGYLLTFLLAGSAAAGVVMGHNSLRGLQLRLLPPEPCFQGHSAQLTVELHNPAARTRYAIALGCADAQRTTPTHWAHTDVPAQGSAALHLGYPAARVLTESVQAGDAHPHEVRIAFDGDAVLFSDEAERVYQSQGLQAFQQHESAKASQPLPDGPFKPLLAALHRLQQVDVPGMRIRTAQQGFQSHHVAGLENTHNTLRAVPRLRQ